MTICHPDQMARIVQSETSGVMFPKGIHQCVAYCFAVEGVPAYEKSVHARIIDMIDDGWVEAFDLSGVNMSGHTTLEKRGEAAKIRQSIADIIGEDELPLHALHARYAMDNLLSKYQGMKALVPIMVEELNTGRFRAQRGSHYVADVVTHVCGSPKKREECCIMAISRLHGINHDRVSRDAERVKRSISRLQNDAFRKIRKIFAVSGIIPLHCCTDKGKNNQTGRVG